jgi:myosin heavy subunit
MLVRCTQDICFKCCPASASSATALPGGTATRTDVGSTSSGDGDSTLASLPAACVQAIHTLSQELKETASLKSKTVELEGRVTQLTEEVNQTASLKRKAVELEGRVTQLTEEVNQTASLKRKAVELEGRVTQLTEEVNQTESLKHEIVELQIQVAEVREKCDALEKEKQALQEKCDQQNGIGIRDLLPDELTAVYGQSLSTATRVASMLKVEEARRELAQEFNDFLCPIELEWMLDPVVASDGHTYDRAQITAWISRCEADEKEPKSPKTNAVLENTSLTPNYALKTLMETCLQNKVKSLVLQDIQEEMRAQKRPRRNNVNA